ncbi:endonuclease [Mesobaculum littorinae]|uniref:Endonuclease n=1 Tax=Mesobaculum littorinae TaxID=2486419 RepID=A0A438AIQ6_9RHOB|nr:endonuclease/exonuclease/phosphatase family protein [Mesobaculum littorinae]RVV98579.1 endonuclease [Mesobaculum littorinae]
MRILRGGLILAMAGLGLVLLAGYGGALHPAGDSLAVFRPELALLLLALSCLGALAGARRSGLCGAALGLAAAAGPIWSMAMPEPPAGAYALYQKNLLYRNATPGAVARDILSAAPDLVTLEELSRGNARVLDLLSDAYPTRATCPGVGGVAVLSRWPAIPGTLRCDGGLRAHGTVAVQVRSPEGPLWVVALHLHWPWPENQAAQVARMRPLLGGLDGPVVVAGDFNMVPWSHTLALISRATGTHRIGRVRRSFDFGLAAVRLRIDHVLVPEGWTGRTVLRARAGSDHFGVLARFGPEGAR